MTGPLSPAEHVMTDRPSAAREHSRPRRRGALYRLVAPVARNVLKHFVLRDPSIRSQHFGAEQMADLAARFLQANAIQGSYLEFGLYRGAAFAHAYRAFRRHKLRIPMFGFDSFAGMPRAGGVDAHPGFRPYAEGHFSCSEDELRHELDRRRVPADAYTLIAGFYEESLRSELYDLAGLAPSGIVLIDCFYYESTRAALHFITPTLQSGTVLICNSYFRFKGHPDHGERGALEAWCRQHPDVRLTEYAKFGTAGIAFIVHP
jgi:O-methyltransferase